MPIKANKIVGMKIPVLFHFAEIREEKSLRQIANNIVLKKIDSIYQNCNHNGKLITLEK